MKYEKILPLQEGVRGASAPLFTAIPANSNIPSISYPRYVALFAKILLGSAFLTASAAIVGTAIVLLLS